MNDTQVPARLRVWAERVSSGRLGQSQPLIEVLESAAGLLDERSLEDASLPDDLRQLAKALRQKEAIRVDDLTAASYAAAFYLEDSTSRTESLKIAYFLWHFPVPSETFVLNELRELVSLGQDVRVFCREVPHPEFTPDFPIVFEQVTSPDELVARLVDTDRTIVHSHFTYPTVTNFVWPVCERVRVPFTFIGHGQDVFRFENDKVNRIGDIGKSPWCYRVLVPSFFHRAYVEDRGVPYAKILVNPNGICPSEYTSTRQSRRKRKAVCAIHRFTEKKGLELLIRAAKLLEDTDITVNIYGYGKLENAYRDLIDRLGATNVSVHGEVKDRHEMLRIFRDHDLFACPFIRVADGDMDGVSTVMMEAMAAGLPVLSTEISGIPDLVLADITGLVCEPTPEGIADGIARFYSMSRAAVKAMTLAAAQRVDRNYNIAILVRNLLHTWHGAKQSAVFMRKTLPPRGLRSD